MVKNELIVIPLLGLKSDAKIFNFNLDSLFFKKFNPLEFSNPQIQTHIFITLNNHCYRLKISLEGQLEIPCDRCCKSMSIQILEEFNQMFKQVSNPKDMNDTEKDPEIMYLGFNDTNLFLDNIIYEFILMSIPNQKLCANYNLKCDSKMVKILKQLAPKPVKVQFPLEEKFKHIKII
ncbi:MAG: DUF177 domain-containing protein [Alphaproteobacteria bacterium]|nr:DUF177 domain-containing protein [Alphaproteobacteria bacterium]